MPNIQLFPIRCASARAVSSCRRCKYSDPELRRCTANNGIAYQCRSCGHMVGNWIRHADLPGLDLAALPAWRFR